MNDTIKTTWSLDECFKQLRFDKSHHLGMGDIRLTMAMQSEICRLADAEAEKLRAEIAKLNRLLDTATRALEIVTESME